MPCNSPRGSLAFPAESDSARQVGVWIRGVDDDRGGGSSPLDMKEHEGNVPLRQSSQNSHEMIHKNDATVPCVKPFSPHPLCLAVAELRMKPHRQDDRID